MYRQNQLVIIILSLHSCAVFINAKSVTNGVLVSDSSDKEVKQKKTFREGTGVLLPCNVTESPDVKVWWTKNESRSTFHQDGIVLRFNVVSRFDGGTYLCHTQNVSDDTNGTVVDYVFLNVQYPGEAPEFYVSNTVLMENDSLTIYAVVEGNPNPTYRVFNNYTGIGWMSANLASNFSLSLQVRCGDSGNYMITGYNKLNTKNFTKSEYVSVLCAPKRDINKNNIYTVYAALGANASLRMDWVGDPNPQFLWRHNGMNVNNRSTQLTNHASAIVFDKVSLSDFGNYSLSLINVYGQYTTMFQLIAKGPPGRPTNVTVLKVNDHSVELGWSTGYDYKLPQTVHIMKWIGNQFMDISLAYVQSTPSGFQYVQKEVSHLDSNTSYRVSLVSENIHGLSQFSEVVPFVTKAERRTHMSHSASDHLGIIIPVSIVGSLALIVVTFAVAHFYRHPKTGQSDSELEKKRIIN